MKIRNLFIKYLSREYHTLLAEKKQIYINNLIKNGLTLGRNVEIIEEFFFDPSHCFLISIGDNCTICPNVRLIAHDASSKKFLGYTKIGKINIKEHCFIGDSVIVLPNVTIGPNSIVGAGSVVTRDIPANSLAAGNPAKVISMIDDYLEKIKTISKNKKIFCEEYFIENLNDKKKREIIQSIGESIGFIV
jgi:maltose O-acetyltransferase